MAGISSCSLCLLLLAVVVVSLTSNAEGRYLPTRSDNNRYERIREVLRALLELSSEAEMPTAKVNYPYDNVYRAKRSSSQSPLASQHRM